MKSGIYKTPNSNLIYVAKDRTIKATTLAPSSWPGTKVSHRAKDDTVLIEGTDYRCERVGDVPNGCNDPVKALNDTKHALQAKAALSDESNPANVLRGIAENTEQGADHASFDKAAETLAKPVGDIYKAVADQVYGVTEAMGDVAKAAVRATSAARALSAPYGRDFTEQQAKMRALGYRRVHKQSARKHRKQGHAVIAAGDGSFWWMAQKAA